MEANEVSDQFKLLSFVTPLTMHSSEDAHNRNYCKKKCKSKLSQIHAQKLKMFTAQFEIILDAVVIITIIQELDKSLYTMP